MDIISGLATVGSYMNDREIPSFNETTTGRIKRNQTNGNNVFNSNNYRQNKKYVDNVAWDRYKQAKDPKSGLIPNFYNQMQAVEKRHQKYLDLALRKEKARLQSKKIKDRQVEPRSKVEGFDNDSVFSDEGSNYSRGSRDSLNLNSDHMAFFKKANMMQDTKYHEKKFVNKINNEKNGFYSQFDDLAYDNPSDPVSSNNVSHNTGKHGNIARMEMERNLALKGNYSPFEDDDMTYGVVDQKDFVHNNMVPFFKSGVGKGYGPNSRVTEQFNDLKQRKVELFSGSTKGLNYKPKTERRPLFNPQVGMTWIYGMPNFTDYFESRYIPSKERRNELLHQPVRITPGLNLGYNEISKQGFHDDFRPTELTVDELRVATNPKISYTTPVISGSKGERRSVIPNVAKHRPIRFKEQDPRDLLKSLGETRAPSIYGNYEAPHTNRQQTTRAWYGPVEFLKDQSKPDSMIEKFRLPHRENFLSDTPRNITGVEKEKNTSYTANTYYAKPTNRITTENNGYVNPAGPEYHKGTAFDMKSNIPDPT
jgi:hypothetical protein